MAHESFEDPEIAALLNNYFISIKVDKEERPDIDSLYMAFCQAFTGGGGWPSSIFMTSGQKPFFAGTYFPKHTRYGMVGFAELLLAIHEKWRQDKVGLLRSAEEMLACLNPTKPSGAEIDDSLPTLAVVQFKRSFDKEFGGFGMEPKFPTPHNLLFLMDYYEKTQDKACLSIAETTLLQMYKGGIFDHIGYGFSRYSTDRYFLAPHFEKMLYDNALLILSYAAMFYITKNPIYRRVAEKIASYIFREMTSPEGGFYSAQDADSDGVEGKFYLFEEDEILTVLNIKDGQRFNECYGITKEGNFEGKNIPNLLHHDRLDLNLDKSINRLDESINQLYEYRKSRTRLHLDKKILTAWNALMIAALSYLYRVTGEEIYLQAAKKADCFIEQNLCNEDILFVSFFDGTASKNGFLDDYAFYCLAQLHLYEATNAKTYLEKALRFCRRAIDDFYDYENRGFYLYGKKNEKLIVTRKETYDGALPSGNSVMTYNLVKLSQLYGYETLDSFGVLPTCELSDRFEDLSLSEILCMLAEEQLCFMSSFAREYPSGHSFYLLALSLYLNVPQHITVVLKEDADWSKVRLNIPLTAIVTLLPSPTEEYPLLNEKTTYYVCREGRCLPPTNVI